MLVDTLGSLVWNPGLLQLDLSRDGAPLRIHAVRMFPGAHFFVQTGQADLLRAVREELALIPDQSLGSRARRPQRARSRPLLP